MVVFVNNCDSVVCYGDIAALSVISGRLPPILELDECILVVSVFKLDACAVLSGVRDSECAVHLNDAVACAVV